MTVWDEGERAMRPGLGSGRGQVMAKRLRGCCSHRTGAAEAVAMEREREKMAESEARDVFFVQLFSCSLLWGIFFSSRGSFYSPKMDLFS